MNENSENIQGELKTIKISNTRNNTQGYNPDLGLFGVSSFPPPMCFGGPPPPMMASQISHSYGGSQSATYFCGPPPPTMAIPVQNCNIPGPVFTNQRKNMGVNIPLPQISNMNINPPPPPPPTPPRSNIGVNYPQSSPRVPPLNELNAPCQLFDMDHMGYMRNVANAGMNFSNQSSLNIGMNYPPPINNFPPINNIPPMMPIQSMGGLTEQKRTEKNPMNFEGNYGQNLFSNASPIQSNQYLFIINKIKSEGY